MNKINIIGLFVLVLWGCANRIQPTGGPKDEDPPELISSVPADGQRNFKEQIISLEFNEFVTINSLKEQLLITPRIENEYEATYRKKTVQLKFDEPFRDSTTYTLNFRDGIVDITEKQPAQNLQIAFSTGDLLDTLEITGHVRQLMTGIPGKEITVGLYEVGDTLDIFTGAPYYFAKTDEEGNYHFRNIKDGKYRMYAFADNNKNLTCQTDAEAYGFLPQPITLDTIIIADTINLLHLNLDTLKLNRVRRAGRYFNILANKYLTDAKLRAENDSLLRYHYDDEHKGLVLYNTFKISDSLSVFSTLKDSLGQIANDTFYISFPATERRPSAFDLSLDNLTANINSATLAGEISFTKPISKIALDSILIRRDSTLSYFIGDSLTLTMDSLEQKIEFVAKIPQAVIDSLNNRKASLADNKKSKANPYELVFKSGTFMSVEMDTSVAMTQLLKFTDPTKLGLLRGKITTDYDSYIIQLLDPKYAIVQESKNGKDYTFSGIKPGEYYIRVLIDENNNGQWDFSDIRNNLPAEPVIIYTDESGNSKTAVRANWEITVDLTF